MNIYINWSKLRLCTAQEPGTLIEIHYLYLHISTKEGHDNMSGISAADKIIIVFRVHLVCEIHN